MFKHGVFRAFAGLHLFCAATGLRLEQRNASSPIRGYNFRDNSTKEVLLWNETWDEDSTRVLQVVQRGDFRAIRLVGDKEWTEIKCGPLNRSRVLACDRQPCLPSNDPDNLVVDPGVKAVVSVGPMMLGSKMARVAIIGVGGGAMIHFLHKLDPKLEIDAVETSKQVAEMSKECFAFPTSTRVILVYDDGLAFLETQNNAHYDWIIIDTGYMQPHFATPEAHDQFLRLLKPNGMITFNNADFQSQPNKLKAALHVAKQKWAFAYYGDEDKSLTFATVDIIHNKKLTPPAKTVQQAAMKRWFGSGLKAVW
eukprot:gnl/TRDRNA2_/TRDRNA2_30816_c0_seq1.p1 gnl/TRDRNA2_/TRDRNA2_30816_c0~~gnl/TRDRNA2_/TRDRNA2_30816_c0_seq1.p1  ORF type:complete len:309 (-),score=42.24 gnl/TRDRNA2_/TRDRNA2_30816_c0_seq1:6-932(-)